MRVRAQANIAAPCEQVWAIVSDPQQALSFLSGITRWEVVSDQPQGIGARYRMLLRVGSAEIGGLIEVVEWVPDRELAWTSVTGIDQRGRFRLRDAGQGRTRVELRLAYGVAGSGMTGWLAERVAAPTVTGHLRRSVRRLKRIAEQREARERASRRGNLRAEAG
jgi:uncharacterized membrane protein